MDMALHNLKTINFQKDQVVPEQTGKHFSNSLVAILEMDPCLLQFTDTSIQDHTHPNPQDLLQIF